MLPIHNSTKASVRNVALSITGKFLADITRTLTVPGILLNLTFVS
ncbi:unnamed protein product [Schistosoma curassoni]|uniref:Mobile element protein n=1 Tax=Schistosoma curassoni TaxID=6186 RepID=A0A183JBX4_9TREM|nr:unnamed protein product [Schistosoma curassoni]